MKYFIYPSPRRSTLYAVNVNEPRFFLCFIKSMLLYKRNSAPIIFSPGGTSETSNHKRLPRSCLTFGTW